VSLTRGIGTAIWVGTAAFVVALPTLLVVCTVVVAIVCTDEGAVVSRASSSSSSAVVVVVKGVLFDGMVGGGDAVDDIVCEVEPVALENTARISDRHTPVPSSLPLLVELARLPFELISVIVIAHTHQPKASKNGKLSDKIT
jgi:hypothetical protein